MNPDQNYQAPITPPTPPTVVMPPVQQAPIVPPATDPGRGLAIAGIVLAFFFQLLGLILSIVAHNKSKNAGFKNTIATVGIVLNSVFLALSLILAPILLTIIFTASSGIQDRAKANLDKSIAFNVVKKSETYFVLTDKYPTTVTDYESSTESSLTDLTESGLELAQSPLTSGVAISADDNSTTTIVELYECGGTGNKVGYWDYDINRTQYVFAGSSTEDSECTLIY